MNTKEYLTEELLKEYAERGKPSGHPSRRKEDEDPLGSIPHSGCSNLVDPPPDRQVVSSMVLINDPFDFKISVDDGFLDTDEKKEQYVDKLLNDIKRVMKKDIGFEAERRKLIKGLKNDPDQTEREVQSSNSKAMDLKSGVIDGIVY